MIAQGIGWYQGNSLLPDFSNWTLLPVVQQSTFFQFDFAWVGEHLLDFAVIVFSFLFVDLFDTVGTLVGVASKGNLLDKDGKLPRAGRALMSDAIGTVVGACLGTSTVTSLSLIHILMRPTLAYQLVKRVFITLRRAAGLVQIVQRRREMGIVLIDKAEKHFPRLPTQVKGALTPAL